MYSICLSIIECINTILSFLAFDFCGSSVVILFFHPRHNGQWPPTSKDFYTRSYPLHNYLNSWERASISLFNVECQTRELLVPFLYHLWYDAVLDWGLNPGPPALEASTLPLGYRWGDNHMMYVYIYLTSLKPSFEEMPILFPGIMSVLFYFIS